MDGTIVISVSDLWGYLLAICSAIVVIAGAVAAVGKWVARAKKPRDDIVSTVAGHSDMLARDKLAQDDLRAGVRVLTDAMLVVLAHIKSGNNVENCAKATQAINQYLIGRK